MPPPGPSPNCSSQVALVRDGSTRTSICVNKFVHLFVSVTHYYFNRRRRSLESIPHRTISDEQQPRWGLHTEHCRHKVVETLLRHQATCITDRKCASRPPFTIPPAMAEQHEAQGPPHRGHPTWWRGSRPQASGPLQKQLCSSTGPAHHYWGGKGAIQRLGALNSEQHAQHEAAIPHSSAAKEWDSSSMTITSGRSFRRSPGRFPT